MKALLILAIAVCCAGCTEKAKDFRSLTSRQLLEMSDGELELQVYDALLNTMEKAGVRNLESALPLLTSGQRALCITMNVDGEVNNGGFNQYYYNTSPDEVALGEGSFRLIGAYQYADIVKEADSVHNQIKGQLDAENNGSLESFSKSYENNPLSSLDDKWYQMSALEPFNNIMVKYIRSHTSEFAKD
jgi:hypothetical protein